jgi:CRP-like cAMP-binding protein
MRRVASRSFIWEQRYPLPLRRKHIADTVGLTPVHVSRVLGVFRERDLMSFSGGIPQVGNLPELERMGRPD